MIKTKDKGYKHSHITLIDKKHHFRSALFFPHMKMPLILVQFIVFFLMVRLLLYAPENS